jgi:HEAT repeat protein
MRRRRVSYTLVLAFLAVGAVFWWVQSRKDEVAARLKDPSPAVRVAAIREADRTPDEDLLIAALSDEDADVRLVAAQRLRGHGPEAAKRARALIVALKDEHAGVRREAAESLYWMGPGSGPALIGALNDPNPRVRAGAALALGDVGAIMGVQREREPGEADAVRPLLTHLLSDEDVEVRRNAARTLKVLARQGPEVETSPPPR